MKRRDKLPAVRNAHDAFSTEPPTSCDDSPCGQGDLAIYWPSVAANVRRVRGSVVRTGTLSGVCLTNGGAETYERVGGRQREA